MKLFSNHFFFNKDLVIATQNKKGNSLSMKDKEIIGAVDAILVLTIEWRLKAELM
jgi:hypothetical protein